jgi:beta-lactam-binding protein with PASTA domain
MWLVGCAPPEPKAPGGARTLEDIESTVPKLSGLPLKNAEKVLTFVGLKVGKVTLCDTEDPDLQGQVVEQEPAPGTAVRGGTAVNVKVYRYVPPAEKGSSTQEK